MAYVPMINEETGEIDHALVLERGDLRACREWGGPNPPPSYVREAHAWWLCALRESGYSDRRRTRSLMGVGPRSNASRSLRSR